MLRVKNLIVASRLDPAGVNIADKLLSLYGFKEGSATMDGKPVYEARIEGQEASLTFTDRDITDTQYLAQCAKPDLAIFVSRHQSLSGTPTLSTHVPGNLGAAEHGGLPKRVSIAPASAMKATLRNLEAQRQALGLPYAVSYEATHHGPSLDFPALFIEIGSTPKEWGDPEAGKAVALSAAAVIGLGAKESPAQASLGIGGLHYNPKFTKIGLSEELAFGHMIPKYATPNLDAEMLRQCVERTVETVKTAVLEWKGVPGVQRAWIQTALRDLGLSVRRV